MPKSRITRASFYATVKFNCPTPPPPPLPPFPPALTQLLNHCILVVVSMMFPNEFSPESHVAFDKFLAALAVALSEKYR